MASKQRSEDIKTGFFVLIALGVFSVFLLNTVGKNWFAVNRKVFHTYFHFVKGLELGAPVGFGGKMIGEVTAIEIATDKELEESGGKEIKVVFEVDAVVPVNSDSVAELSTISLMSVVYVEISTGDVKTPDKRLETGSYVKSKEIVSMDNLFSTAGDVAQEAKGLIAKLSKMIDDVGDAPTKDALKKAIQETDDVMAEVKTTIEDFHKIVNEQNRQKVDEIIGNIKDFTDDLKTKMETSFKNIESLTGRIDDIAAENREKINELFTNLKQSSEDLKLALKDVGEMTSQNKENINKVLSSFTETADKLQASMDKNMDEINESIYNIRLMTENGVELTDKIKRYPWKLIWKTSEKEPYQIKTLR